MWQEKNKALHQTFVFTDFAGAFAFMTRVASLAEKLNHHPYWTNNWNKVDIYLSTHDAGSTITGKDRNMAREIDKIINSKDVAL